MVKDLLQMDGTTHLIEWIDFSKLEFRIKDGARVSRLWSQVNGRQHDISYESFKRTIRHYYGKGIVEKILKKPHCYKFVKSSKTMAVIADLDRKRTQTQERKEVKAET